MTLFDSWIDFVHKNIFVESDNKTDWHFISEFTVTYSFHLYLDNKEVIEFVCFSKELFDLIKKSIFDLMGVEALKLDSIHIWETGETKYCGKILKFYYKEDFKKTPMGSNFKKLHFYRIDKSLGFSEKDVLEQCEFLTKVKNGIYT